MANNKEFRPKWLAWATVLSVIGGIAMTIVGSINGISGLVTAGLVVAFGLTMVLNVGTAIYAVIKSVKEDGRKYPKTSTPQNRAGCVIGIIILILFISVPLVATVFFSRGKEAIGGAIIGGMFAAVFLAIVIANVRQKAKKGTTTTNTGSAYSNDDDEDEEENKEKSSFDQYMEANDAFEEFIDGDADIFLSADEYEQVIHEGDVAYDEYMLGCDKYGGESQGEILYAKKLYEIIRKYKLIIKSKNPEYETDESDFDIIDGKKQMVATLVQVLKSVADKKQKEEYRKIGMATIERESKKLEKPDYSVFSISPKKDKSRASLKLADILKRVADEKETVESAEIDTEKIEKTSAESSHPKLSEYQLLAEQRRAERFKNADDVMKWIEERKENNAKNSENSTFDAPKIEKSQITPKKPSYATPNYATKSEQAPTESKEKNTEKIAENSVEKKQENTAAPKHAAIGYKGIKKK